MQISLAPLEGVTGYVVRNAFHHNFGGIDTYYTPFISAGKNLKGKSLRDILPENNEGIRLIPQLMSNSAEDVLRMSRQLAAYGYDHINLNLGCPSGTVTSKKRGSGLLSDLELLDRFLYEVFARTDMKISVKTRIGFSSPEEWPAILELYQKYPLEELIIHPRVRAEFYNGTPHLECFAQAVRAYAAADTSWKAPGASLSSCLPPAEAKTVLCYNGDIASVSDCRAILEQFPGTAHIMIGRGLIAHPGLAAAITHAVSTADSAQSKELPTSSDATIRSVAQVAHPHTPGMQEKSSPVFTDAGYRARIRAFHDEIYSGLCASFSGEKDAMLHMKEIWGFLKDSFAGSDKAVKKIRKAQSCMEYKAAVCELFSSPREYPIVNP